MHREDEDRDNVAADVNRLMLAILLAVICAIALVFVSVKGANAEGNPSKKTPTIKAPERVQVAQAADKSWTGAYVGGFGQYSIGELDFGAPFNLASSGQQVGGLVGATVQTGQIVVGGEVAYSWVYGDLHDLGIKNELEITGKAGFLLMPNVLLYGHFGWSQIDTSFVGKVEGWKVGPGVELRMDGGWSLDGRAGYGWYDIDALAPPGIDATMKYVRIGLNKRFDMPKGLFGQ